MKAYGLKVYVFVSPVDESLQNKINWISDNLGQDWRYRVIAVPHKHLLTGDIIIDDGLQNLRGSTNDNSDNVNHDFIPNNSVLVLQKEVHYGPSL
jgi:5'(3')-deoxyribonucleotidase